MQASVQTQRKKKPELAPIGTAVAVPEPIQQDDKQKEKKIKKLTLINRELIDTLKRQNQQLTKKINKQKIKLGRSVERVQSPTRNLQKQKKQLANAYKQIEMYKAVLKDLKAKEISTESADKLNMLQNKIRVQDASIQQLHKQLKYVKNIKQSQQKELHLYENNDVKTSVTELQDELKQLKEKLKMAKRQAKKRQDMAMKQHAYFIELERTLRKQNNEYYPGLTSKPNRESSTAVDAQEITQRQWQVLRAQLVQLKRNHQENNKKIEVLTRLRNKQIKSFEDNQTMLKQKQRKLNAIKIKMNQVAKLVGQDKKSGGNRQNGQGEQAQYEYTMQNGKKVFKAKNPQNQRGVKKWMIPEGEVREKGKIMPDSIFCSDKNQLKVFKKSKIVRIQVWYDSAQTPALCQFHYRVDDNRQVKGIIPFTTSQIDDLNTRVVEFKEGDYLTKISGKIKDGFVTSLTFVSKFGKNQTFNAGGQGQSFKLEARPNQLPTIMFGAVVRDNRDNLKICYIGCEFITDW